MLEGSGCCLWRITETSEPAKGAVLEGVQGLKEVWVGIGQGKKKPKVHQGQLAHTEKANLGSYSQIQKLE